MHLTRRTALTIFLLSPLAARAEARVLTADEVRALLTDARIEGDWNGTPYRQRFDASGHTIYEAEGHPPDPGRWRVNDATGAYESLWRMGGWAGYHIEKAGENLFWLDSRGRRYPFRVMPD